jgi:hypothetical protein
VPRERSQGILGFLGLVVVCAALGYGAWMALTRPKPRDGAVAARPVYTGPDSVGFFAVAGEGVDLEVAGPGGVVSTASGAAGPKLPRSESSVDCPGVASPGAAEAACTVSINVGTPVPGDYTVTVRGSNGAARATLLNVGWGSAAGARRGGFDVRVQVTRGGATAFGVLVAREGVSQRSEPRAVSR